MPMPTTATILAALISTSPAGGSPCPPGGPTNDCAVNATLIYSGESLPFNTSTANTDGPSNFQCSYGKDVWYLFQAPADGELTITLDTPSFDSTLAVYYLGVDSEFTPAELPLLFTGCVDAEGPGGETTAFSATGGVYYLLQVAGFSSGGGGQSGPGAISVSLPAGGCETPSTGSCLIAHPEPGCDDVACCTTVCAIDPFCCDTQWDAICVGEAMELCALASCEIELVSIECLPGETGSMAGNYMVTATVTGVGGSSLAFVAMEGNGTTFPTDGSLVVLSSGTPTTVTSIVNLGPGPFSLLTISTYDLAGNLLCQAYDIFVEVPCSGCEIELISIECMPGEGGSVVGNYLVTVKVTGFLSSPFAVISMEGSGPGFPFNWIVPLPYGVPTTFTGVANFTPGPTGFLIVNVGALSSIDPSFCSTGKLEVDLPDCACAIVHTADYLFFQPEGTLLPSMSADITLTNTAPFSVNWVSIVRLPATAPQPVPNVFAAGSGAGVPSGEDIDLSFSVPSVGCFAGPFDPPCTTCFIITLHNTSLDKCSKLWCVGAPQVNDWWRVDGIVNGEDLGLVLGAWGSQVEPFDIGDVNGDGLVDGSDLGLLLGMWGKVEPTSP